MNNKISIFTSLIILNGLLFNSVATAGANEDSALEAAADFYEALNVMFTGDLGPMKEVWSHADDVTYMSPLGGYQVGWTDTLKVWETSAAMKLGGKVEAADLHVIASNDLAIVQNHEVGSNIGPDGEIEKVSIRATNIFRKEKGEWKMVSHHTDLLPYLSK
jgi:ketosteroid isomerase-like protein